jgi:tetratricopeptide (TPR) repeat protein
LFPDNPVALEHLGVLLTEQGQLPEAIQALEAVVEKMPTEARRVALAQAYLKNKQPDKAQAVIEPAVAAAPRDLDLRMFYGRLLRDQRKFPDAAAQFLAAAQIKPDFAPAWSELASVLMVAEQYPQALAAYDRLRALGAENTGEFFFRALAHDRLAQRPEAIENYKKFLAASQGKFPNQEFQARQRIRILENELKKR